MVNRLDPDATRFSEEDIERWGAEADGGLVEWEFGKSATGRTIRVPSSVQDARPGDRAP